MKVEVKMDGRERERGLERGRKEEGDKQGRNKEQQPSRFTVYVI